MGSIIETGDRLLHLAAEVKMVLAEKLRSLMCLTFAERLDFSLMQFECNREQ